MVKPGQSGRLRHYVTIQQDVSAAGAEQPSWATFAANVPCRVYEIRGGETFRGKQMEGDVSHVIETRYLVGLAPTMRVVWDGKTIDITSILDRDGRKRYLEIQGNQINPVRA